MFSGLIKTRQCSCQGDITITRDWRSGKQIFTNHWQLPATFIVIKERLHWRKSPSAPTIARRKYNQLGNYATGLAPGSAKGSLSKDH
ncbi:hypothetical protein HDE_05106 [Halotydeus destructor]|nr:hypothetical protein HDE_05106 [Halotydeus destructor]